jgi:hypothetical protein
MGIVERLGAKLFVERLRLEWRAGTPLPEPAGRLAFRPVHDPGELVDLMTLVLDGTLDAHSRDDLTRMTARAAAEEQYRAELERHARTSGGGSRPSRTANRSASSSPPTTATTRSGPGGRAAGRP